MKFTISNVTQSLVYTSGTLTKWLYSADLPSYHEVKKIHIISHVISSLFLETIQDTTPFDSPIWKQIDPRASPPKHLDQVLEYGYEGLDGKPPPEFCPSGPSSSIGGDEDDGDDDVHSDGRRHRILQISREL